jgi:hypothetical protein
MDCLKAKEMILKDLVSEFNLRSLDIDITFYETKLKKSCLWIIDQFRKSEYIHMFDDYVERFLSFRFSMIQAHNHKKTNSLSWNHFALKLFAFNAGLIERNKKIPMMMCNSWTYTRIGKIQTFYGKTFVFNSILKNLIFRACRFYNKTYSFLNLALICIK